MSVTVHQAGAVCPSCGCFVGPLDKCPYCGADIQKRIPLRHLRVACLFLALLGVGVLVYATSGAPTPTVKIESLGATVNFAYVRLEGTVTRGPIYNPDAQALRFYLADETGEIQVAAFRSVTQELVQAERVPAAGDHITVEGTLRVRDDFTTLNVAAGDKLKIEHPSARRAKIGDVGQADALQVVTVRGEAREIRQPYHGLTLITVNDGSGELDVAISSDIEKLYGAAPLVNPGDAVVLQGVVTFYRNEPQLVLRHPRDLIIENAARSAQANPTSSADSKTAPQASLFPAATRRPTRAPTAAPIARAIGSLTASDKDARVVVTGKITRAEDFSKGARYTLDDATGTILVVVWSDVLQGIPQRAAFRAGAQVRITGRVELYNNALELVPQKAVEVELVAPAPEPTAEPLRAIHSLSSNDLDQIVLIQGTIADLAAFSKGKYATLQDDSGKIQVTIFSNVLAPLHDKLAIGARAAVRGKLNLYRGKLEIIADEIVIR